MTKLKPQGGGYWIKMTKTNDIDYRTSYHYQIADAPKKKTRQKYNTNNFEFYRDNGPSVHPLDPLGDLDPRLHLSDTDWGVKGGKISKGENGTYLKQ